MKTLIGGVAFIASSAFFAIYLGKTRVMSLVKKEYYKNT